ncbi:hypothetical protein [Roseibium sp.]|uniref:hypothetical protein n=1 Tax=Roseibium sp. TaxID=1936156 RepID=UPI003D13CE80
MIFSISLWRTPQFPRWTCVACVLFFGSISHSAAQPARPDTRNLTCDQARALVQKRGSVVMTTGTNTFEKFIADASYCMQRSMTLRSRLAPTKDNPSCTVGYRCHSNRGNRSN